MSQGPTLLLVLLGCEGARPALPQDVYVWQRAWTPEVRAAVSERSPHFRRVAVLAAELSGETEPQVTEIALDPGSLQGRPVIAVLRAPWRDDLATWGLPAHAARTVDRLRAQGVDLVALQLDVDVASGQLARYAAVLREVRAAVPVPLSITGLPDWLSRPELPALLAEVGSWTLQLHSFEAPSSPDALQPLVDPDAARVAIRRASALGVPFEIALPTHGYTAAFTPEGRFLGATAERALPWSAAVETRELRADPVALAALVSELEAHPPPGLAGILWFRLPTEADAHAWRWPTLRSVMEGRAPAPELRAGATAEDPGLYELFVRNDGDADAHLPDLRLRAPASPLAVDAYAGFRPVLEPEGLVLRAREGQVLGPGEARPVGWARFEGPVEVSLDVLD